MSSLAQAICSIRRVESIRPRVFPAHRRLCRARCAGEAVRGQRARWRSTMRQGIVRWPRKPDDPWEVAQLALELEAIARAHGLDQRGPGQRHPCQAPDRRRGRCREGPRRRGRGAADHADPDRCRVLSGHQAIDRGPLGPLRSRGRLGDRRRGLDRSIAASEPGARRLPAHRAGRQAGGDPDTNHLRPVLDGGAGSLRSGLAAVGCRPTTGVR